MREKSFPPSSEDKAKPLSDSRAEPAFVPRPSSFVLPPEGRLSVVLVAAGGSRRMGFDKLTADLAGCPVAAWAAAAFEDCAEVGEIVVVTAAGREDEFRVLLAGRSKVRAIVPGGAERHRSVWAGLRATDPTAEFVAVHDAARPLATPALVTRCLARARAVGAAAAASPVADTLKRVDPATGLVAGGVDRTDLWAMGTPQVFRADLLRRACEHVLATGETVTDEVSAVERLGAPVALVDTGEDPNFKITYPRDLALARLVLAGREPLRGMTNDQ